MKVEFRDYYKILGVSREADEKEIKRAYRRLARKTHPDVNPGDPSTEERFKEVTEAYEVLSDPEKRSKYDRFGAAWRNTERAGTSEGFDWSSWTQPTGGRGAQYTYATAEGLEELFGRSGFSDFFETLFGGGGGVRRSGPTRARRGRDLEQPVQISLYEAYAGAKRLIDKNGRRLEVTIPPGVKTGSRVRMAGAGVEGTAGGGAGDLFLVVEVAPDPRFRRTGDDLTSELDVPLATAILGGEVRVPTLAGDVQLKIAPETQNGRRIRLAGQGMPKLKNPTERGDLYLTVQVQLPAGLTDEERRLFERLRELRGGS